MVRLKLKRETENMFIMDTTLDKEVDTILDYVVRVQNGRLKIERLCYGTSAKVMLCVSMARVLLITHSDVGTT